MIKRTKLGLLWALHVQYDALQVSASMFDVGHRGEAVRMANAMYILLAPSTKNHVSIIDRLDFEKPISIVSTAHGPNEPSRAGTLVILKAVPYLKSNGHEGGWGVAIEPDGDVASSPQTSIAAWWEENVVGGKDGFLSRLKVARLIRDRDGGAHLDLWINDQSYMDVLLNGGGYQYRRTADDEPRPVEGLIEATVRQMANEVIYSLQSLHMTALHEIRKATGKGPINRLFFADDGTKQA